MRYGKLNGIGITPMDSLCTTCEYVRKVVTGTGSVFLMCELSRSDARYAKYPPQSVVRCSGYSQRTENICENPK